MDTINFPAKSISMEANYRGILEVSASVESYDVILDEIGPTIVKKYFDLVDADELSEAKNRIEELEDELKEARK